MQTILHRFFKPPTHLCILLIGFISLLLFIMKFMKASNKSLLTNIITSLLKMLQRHQHFPCWKSKISPMSSKIFCHVFRALLQHLCTSIKTIDVLLYICLLFFHSFLKCDITCPSTRTTVASFIAKFLCYW